MKTTGKFLISAAILLFGTLAVSAQTNKYLYSGSEVIVTLNPGTYNITAYGAEGGYGINTKEGPSTNSGGLGAEMEGQFSFPTITTLTLLVGGGGGGGGFGAAGGGGGGSFVVNGSTPLVVGGGGGGAGTGPQNPGSPGLITTSGGDGGTDVDENDAAGGTNGSGGFTASQGGGGGGGYSGNGSLHNPYVVGGGVGMSFLNGGAGGSGSGGGNGGYGGGGGAYHNSFSLGAGGGGGYSGGGGGTGGGSAGGGSVIDSSAIADLAAVSGVASLDGSINGEIIITAIVSSPPIIISQPTNNTVTAGGTASFSVIVSGTAPISYLWLSNGTNVAGGTNATLTLNDVQADQAGSYMVQISNTFGTTNSVEAALTVNPGPFAPYIISQPTNETAAVKTTATFSVSVSAISPTYQWFRNSAKLTASSRISGVTNATLTTSNLTMTDAGTYFVKISNAYGTTISSNAVLTVFVPDTTKPTITITAPKANQRWSNDVFTVIGTTKDNAGVTNVFYSLNHQGWTNAVTTDGWTNWTASVSLTPGTNTIQACAMDSSGNVSETNSVNFAYILSAVLTISTNGEGTVSPHYNGVLLQIGQTYSVTATAKTGFKFTDWTDGSNDVLTNKAALKFIMASNLTLIANFSDVIKPKLTITAPATGHHMTNALALVTGTASDNWKVASVWYQLNSNSWSLATSTNGWTNWMTFCRLNSGTNTIKAYATDLGGNFSDTESVSVISSNAFKLLLNPPLTGDGTGLSVEISQGINGRIQVSTNLINWVVLTNFVGTNSPVRFSDPTATNFNQRFYRAITP